MSTKKESYYRKTYYWKKFGQNHRFAILTIDMDTKICARIIEDSEKIEWECGYIIIKSPILFCLSKNDLENWVYIQK